MRAGFWPLYFGPLVFGTLVQRRSLGVQLCAL